MPNVYISQMVLQKCCIEKSQLDINHGGPAWEMFQKGTSSQGDSRIKATER